MPSFAKLVPWLLLFGFIVLAWLLFGQRFIPAREVALEKVITMRASTEVVRPSQTETSDTLSFEGSAVFQASGWVEPDPQSYRVTTLYSGVVESMHVLQGEAVVKGQILAKMVDDDAELDLATAQAAFVRSEANLEQWRAKVAASESSLESTDHQIEAAIARLDELQDQATRLTKAGSEVFRESEITQSKLRVVGQERTIRSLRAKKSEQEAMLRSNQAAARGAEADLQLAKVDVDRKQLALDRTEVRSPFVGRIQFLYAAPGMKRMLNMDNIESASIASIYDPAKLQARIDVPLEEAAQLSIGQAVRIRSSLLPDESFQGIVTRIDGQADLQRNTLQAKVRILNPNDQLRPEMLCRAEFLNAGARPGFSLTQSSSARASVYVPAPALIGTGNEQSVWVLDASGQRVEKRSVQSSPVDRDGYHEVIEGLLPGDFVVLNPPADLKVGQRVKRLSGQ